MEKPRRTAPRPLVLGATILVLAGGACVGEASALALEVPTETASGPAGLPEDDSRSLNCSSPA